MTEKISTPDSRSPQKSFFKRYLKYCFGENKVYFLMSLICSVMSAAVFTAILTIYNSQPHFLDMGMNTRKVVGTFTFFAFAAIWGQYVLCITGGIRCFQHLTRKNKTDTLMCLPLTHSERFWGDLLTGYLTTAAPLLPCGILGIIAAAIARGTGKLPENLVEFALVFTATLFFVMTFAYLLSVLAASLCGNRAGGIVTAVLLAAISVGIPAAWGEYFIANIIGFPMFGELAFHPHTLIPSAALITEFDDFVDYVGIFSFGLTRSFHNFQISDYAVANPLNIVFYVLLSLGLIALSYLISKNRKCEHTGEIFAAKHAATVITILAAFTMTGVLSYLFNEVTILAAIISAIVVSAVICLAAELILRRGVKKLGRRVIVYAVSTAVSVGFSVLISVTYALGMSFVLPSADKIKSVEFMQGENTQYDAFYKFDQKQDIEKLRESHSRLLKEHIRLLDSNRYQYNGNPDLTTIKYTLESGETFLRTYLINYNITIYDENIPGEHMARAALKAMPTALEDYPAQYAAPLLSDKLISTEISLGGTFGTYRIYPKKLPEFAQILHDDIVSHHSPDTLPIGSAEIATEKKDCSFDILETYENTIAFIKDTGNAEFISETPFTLNFYGKDADFRITLTEEDMDSPTGKELKALMKSCHPSDVETISSEEYRSATRISSPDYYTWYVPQSNMLQVIKLITEIASERT